MLNPLPVSSVLPYSTQRSSLALWKEARSISKKAEDRILNRLVQVLFRELLVLRSGASSAITEEDSLEVAARDRRVKEEEVEEVEGVEEVGEVVEEETVSAWVPSEVT